MHITANGDGTCKDGWSHFPGADPSSCYSSSVVNPPTSGASSTATTTNTGGNTSTPMTTPMKTGGGTTTTGTGAVVPTGGANGTGTSTSTSTTTTTTKIINNNNIVKGRPSASGNGGVNGTQDPTSTTTAPSVIYVNIPDKITIRYPSTWTKTEFADNPDIPVIFNAPINDTTTKTTLMININNPLTPASATPDAYTQQQINALTNSSVIKYTITDTNSKVLTPPTGGVK